MSLQRFSKSFKALGGPNEIQLYANSQAVADAMFNILLIEVERIERKYSRYLPDSVVSQINASAGHSRYQVVDEETTFLLNYAQTCFEHSEGLFDITSGSLRRVWDFAERKIPNESTLREALSLVGWNDVHWDGQNIFLPRAGMELDFGGIGKEYAVDRLASIVRSQGIKSALLTLGGDIAAIGTHADGNLWKIGVQHPRIAHAVLTFIESRDACMATSGDYEKYFELDGKRYCHILNPITGFPVSGFQSVTVVASNCLVAGSMATISMLFGEKKGKKFLSSLQLPYVAVASDGSVVWQDINAGDTLVGSQSISDNG